MLFGGQTDERTAGEMISMYGRSGGDFLDSAYVYTEGETERIIGRYLREPGRKEGWRIATKAHPRVFGRLDAETVRRQLEESLSRLGLEAVELFYLHAPDAHTPVERALEECGRLYEEGKYRRLGLSNFPAWMVWKVAALCRQWGIPAPDVYQGMYNALTRRAEEELFPALRDLGMSCYAYNPLAGGILTGKYRSVEDLPSTGRFMEMPFYQDRYWHPALFRALDKLRSLGEREGLTPAEAAFRWLVHHSALSGEAGDGIIVGASTLPQLRENMELLRGGPLSGEVVGVLEQCWQIARCESPSYFRYYYSD
jgi:aflatoxin B1 aldehyde reductase